MKCIICRTEKDPSELSDEHVIPDSLGGYYHIYSVCQLCNSQMGQTIDSALVNHKLTELYRFVERIAGKSGAVPNPFGVASSSENPEVKARAMIDEDGALSFLLLPRVVVHEDDGIVKSIDIVVDAKEEAKIQDILRKKLERLGIDESSARAEGELARSMLGGGFSMRWQVDTRSFKIGLLKIAYEFAVDSIDDYFDTQEAVEISRILRGTDHQAVSRFVTIGSGLEPEVFEPFKNYLDSDSKKHYLVLINTDMGLMCCVKLHNLFCVGVVLSAKRHLGEGNAIFGINDIANRTFRKLQFEQLLAECMGPLHIRLAYWFSESEEAERASAEINAPGYRYECNEKGDPVLFDAEGAPDPRSLENVLSCSYATDSRQDDWFVTRFEFHPSDTLFVRSVGTGNLYRVMGIETSRQHLTKV